MSLYELIGIGISSGIGGSVVINSAAKATRSLIEWRRSRAEKERAEVEQKTAEVEKERAEVEEVTGQFAALAAAEGRVAEAHKRDVALVPDLLTEIKGLRGEVAACRHEREECRDDLTAEKVLGVRRDAAIELLADEVERRGGNTSRVAAVRDLLRPTKPPDDAGPPRILVVDDDETARGIACRLVMTLDYRYVGVGSAAQALAVVTAGDVDAVLCDVRMPGESGVQFVKRMRELGVETPVVLVTGAPLDVEDIARELAVDVLSKPYTRAELEQVLKRTIAKVAS